MLFANLKENSDIQSIHPEMDIVKDNLGNFYYVVGASSKNNMLTDVKLEHCYHRDASVRTPGQKEPIDIKEHLVDRLQDSLTQIDRASRKLFTVDDLLKAGINVSFVPLTSK
ncbi:hypothetical protein MHH67_13285 [Bacillus sp. FSL K6-0047]